VFGIAGVDGNGQSQLVETITGMHNPTDGSITHLGEPMADESRREHIDRGMAFIPEDRQERGLVMSYDLTENGILGSQHDPPFAEGGRLDWRASRDHAESVIEQYDVRLPRTPTPRRNRSLAATSRSSSSAGSSSAIRNWSWRCTRRGGSTSAPRSSSTTACSNCGPRGRRCFWSLEVRRSTGALRPARRDPRGEFTGVDPATVTEEEIGLLMAGETLDDDSVEGLRSHNAGPDPVGNGGVETDTGTDDTLEKTDDDIENEEVDA